MSVDDRVDRLRELAREAGLDAVIATNDASIAYFTGFHGLQLERLFAVVVTVDGGGAIVAPSLDGEAVEAAPTGLARAIYPPSSNGLPKLLGALGGARRVGVEETHLIHARARALVDDGREPAFADALVMALRARKDAAEVAAIERACHVVTEVMEEMFARLRPGDVEREVNARVDFELRARGATDSHPLILFGPNGAKPHSDPGERVLAEGDVVVADVSACIEGYWGDLTRGASVGPPSDWARAAWEVVREAQVAAIDATRVGATAGDVDAAQRAIVEAHPELGQCLHGAGHAIGGEIHEPPYLVPGNDAPLAEGMVFTVEPGIYQPGTGGIRLEDDVLVTADGPRTLSALPLELREVPVDGSNP
jgi:Xaa-Pro aminopeptidase